MRRDLTAHAPAHTRHQPQIPTLMRPSTVTTSPLGTLAVTGDPWGSPFVVEGQEARSCATPTAGRTLPGTHAWGPQVDHLIELQDNGPMWDETNLALCHATCNRRKGRARQHQRKQEQLRARAYRLEQRTLDAIESVRCAA